MAKPRKFGGKEMESFVSGQATERPATRRLPTEKGQLNLLISTDVIAWVRQEAKRGGEGYNPSHVVEKILRREMERERN